MRKLDVLLRNVDNILKWMGYISAMLIVICIIVLFFVLLAADSWNRGEYATKCLIWAICAFASMVTNFSLFTVVKAAKIYIGKNEESDEECE